jgi:hypothetical protein
MGAEAVKSVRGLEGYGGAKTDHTLERMVAHFPYALHREDETQAKLEVLSKPSRKTK